MNSSEYIHRSYYSAEDNIAHEIDWNADQILHSFPRRRFERDMLLNEIKIALMQIEREDMPN